MVPHTLGASSGIGLGRAKAFVDAVLYLEAAPFVSGEVVHVGGGAHAGRW